MSKPMTAFTTDFQHSGMVAKDLDETIAFYTEKLGFEVAGIFHIDSFWEHGIRFFNVYGPNGETIEFCQIV